MNSLYDTMQSSPAIRDELCACGIAPNNLSQSDITTKLFSGETFLKAHNIDIQKVSSEILSVFQSASPKGSSRPFLLALLPCGLRNTFKEAFTRAFPEYADDECEDVFIEGNLNYERIIYQYIDSLTSVEELPEVLVTSDFNSLYHHYFYHHFLKSVFFEPIAFQVSPVFANAGYAHPQQLMGMLTANLLVMMVDTSQFKEDEIPRNWHDLLSPGFRNKLMLRGDNDFFCNAVFLPFYQRFGIDSIARLAENTFGGMHPSAMVKAISSGNTHGCSVFVMPYSFALKIRNTGSFKMVWPDDGAIASPVQMLVKKGAYSKYKNEIDFITGSFMAGALEQIGFPSVCVDNTEQYPKNKLTWLGWDFIEKNDLRMVKQEIQQVFFEYYKSGKVC